MKVFYLSCVDMRVIRVNYCARSYVVHDCEFVSGPRVMIERELDVIRPVLFLKSQNRVIFHVWVVEYSMYTFLISA